MSSKQTSRWVALSLVILGVGGFLVGVFLLLRPVAAAAAEPSLVNFASTALGRSGQVQKHFYFSDSVIREAVVLDNGALVGRLSCQGFTGIHEFWAVFNADFSCRALKFPYEPRWEGITSPGGLDTLSGASIDSRLIKGAIQSASNFLANRGRTP